MTLRHWRILHLLVVAALCALVIPDAVCYEGGWGLWSGSSCKPGDQWIYRAVFTVPSWFCVYMATMIWREYW